MSDIKSLIEKQVDSLLDSLSALIPDVVEDVLDADKLAIINKVPWYNRHRLGVLIESAKNARELIGDNILYSPWFLHELGVYVGLMEKWKDNDIWESITGSLKDRNHFRHTMLKLLLADHFTKQGKIVKIVPKNIHKTPDIMMKDQNKEAKWFYIECYQPAILSGTDEKISKYQINKIVKRVMDKAKNQFNRHYPGIIALCSYYQTNNDLSLLKDSFQKRLKNIKRPYFGGVLLLNFYVEIFKSDSISSSAKYTIYFTYNSSYFGKILIETNDDLTHMKKSLILPLINKNQLKHRTIIYTETDVNRPFFIGKSNLDLKCGKCGAILAENTWELSLSNLILLCPVCKSYNECPVIEHRKYGDLINRIAIDEGEYRTNQSIHLRVGCIVIGKTKKT